MGSDAIPVTRSSNFDSAYSREIHNLSEQVKMLEKQLEKAEECLGFYADESCNEDWCDRYLPEHDLAIIDYLSGKKARNYFKEKESGE